jgi:hypothetical protein
MIICTRSSTEMPLFSSLLSMNNPGYMQPAQEAQQIVPTGVGVNRSGRLVGGLGGHRPHRRGG